MVDFTLFFKLLLSLNEQHPRPKLRDVAARTRFLSNTTQSESEAVTLLMTLPLLQPFPPCPACHRHKTNLHRVASNSNTDCDPIGVPSAALAGNKKGRRRNEGKVESAANLAAAQKETPRLQLNSSCTQTSNNKELTCWLSQMSFFPYYFFFLGITMNVFRPHGTLVWLEKLLLDHQEFA